MLAGIDLSTKAVDIVCIDEDEVGLAQHRRVPLPKEWWLGARTMRETMLDHGVTGWLYDRNVRLIGVERPYGPSRGALAALHTILGAVLSSLPRDIHVFEVSPADMRRELGLLTNCNKGVMHNAVVAKLDPVVEIDWPEDGYDAWAAAYACLRINERGTPVAEGSSHANTT